MVINKSFSFPVSLSREAFIDKTISNAMIGSGMSEENREIREKYGFNPNRGIGFERTYTTPQALLDELLKGKVFCHLFNPQKTRKDGSFGSCEKTNANFAGSYVIGVDIDETSYPSAKDYVATLTLKPTFYYSSYSNQQKGKGARFRLIYVFNSLIIPDPMYFRYVAWNLNRIIEKDTNEVIEDNCNLRCAQYFNGTNKDLPGINLEYGITNEIYDFSDLGVSDEGYYRFLRGNGHYKTLTSDKRDYINRYLSMYGMYYKEDSIQQHTIINDKRETPDISPRLIEDMKRMSYDEFMKYNRHKFTYSYRKESEDWIDDIYQFTPEGYFSLYWNATKVKDGQKRRKKIYERICLRRVMNPEIDPDTLLFCAYEDRYRFFEIDKDLDIDCLVKNVEAAMELEISDIEEMYSKNLEYLRGKSKSGIIFKSGTYESKADLKAVTWNLISEIYNPSKSIKENLVEVNKKIKVSERTLYRFCKEKGYKTDKARLSDEELKDLLDSNLSVRKNLALLKEQGIKVGIGRVQRLLKSLN